MKNMNEIIKYDKEGNITKEWIEYVENLDREDLERFFIGAYTLSDKRKERINEAIEYIEKERAKDEEDNFIDLYLDKYENDLLDILKGVDKE